MKFLAVLALVAVKAQDEEAEALEAGADCTEGVCGEGLCCGTAGDASDEEAELSTLCGPADGTTVENEDGDELDFACNEVEEGASKLAASVAALATAAYI